MTPNQKQTKSNQELNKWEKIQRKMFVINCKNYEEISGDKIIKFVKIAEKVSKKYKVKIAICGKKLEAKEFL